MPSTENLLALSRLYEIPLDAFVKDMCQEGEAIATADVGSPEQPTAKRTPKRHVAKWICTACIVALFTALGFALGSEWGEHESQIVDMGDLPAESWNDANVEEFPVELP